MKNRSLTPDKMNESALTKVAQRQTENTVFGKVVKVFVVPILQFRDSVNLLIAIRRRMFTEVYERAAKYLVLPLKQFRDSVALVVGMRLIDLKDYFSQPAAGYKKTNPADLTIDLQTDNTGSYHAIFNALTCGDRLKSAQQMHHSVSFDRGADLQLMQEAQYEPSPTMQVDDIDVVENRIKMSL